MTTILPPIGLTSKQVKFKATLAEVLEAIGAAAPNMSAVGGIWKLDGHNSNSLFLRMVCDPDVPGLPPHIDTDFDIEVTEESVTISVCSRAPGKLALFDQLVAALTPLLSQVA
ncbi:hypothetical protein [Deinococcus sp. PESE-13]